MKMKKLLALVASLLLFTCSAQAADWNFYGVAKLDTFYMDMDYKGSSHDTSKLSLDTPTTTLLGARVKASDNVSGWFEYGTAGGNASVRVLWATYNFGAGQLGVGQMYTPLNLFYSKQTFSNDLNMLSFGGVYGGRNPMVRLKFGGFQIAAVEPNSDLEDKTGNAVKESRMPAIEAKYTKRGKTWMAQVAAGYNTFEVTSGGNSFDVDSYMVAAGGSVNLGAFYLKGDAFVGQNVGNMVMLYTSGSFRPDGTLEDDGLATLNAAGTQLVDRENHGCLLVAGYKLNERVTLEAGWGYASNDEKGTQVEDDVEAYYAQARITLAPGVTMTPEIGYIDFKQMEDFEPEVTYYGARFQIAF